MTGQDKTIEKFYSAFSNKDWKTMQELYHEEVVFSDPVFENLKGKEAMAMWHMLTMAAQSLTINFKNIRSEGNRGSCDWDAVYPFSLTGKVVHNIIHAEFEFQDGKIIRHTDTFNLWRWAGMALGFSGKLLGWTSLVQSKIRSKARKNLDKFISAHPEYQS